MSASRRPRDGWRRLSVLGQEAAAYRAFSGGLEAAFQARASDDVAAELEFRGKLACFFAEGEEADDAVVVVLVGAEIFVLEVNVSGRAQAFMHRTGTYADDGR